MQVQLRKLSSIKPCKRNPRANEKAVEAAARSIAEFGFRQRSPNRDVSRFGASQPIVVDNAGVIVVGHVRYKAAQKLGLKQAPVHVARDLSPAQIRAYRLADNKTAEAATWDPELLPLELRALKDDGVDLELTGFRDPQLADLLADFDTEVEAPPAGDGEGLCGSAMNACAKAGFDDIMGRRRPDPAAIERNKCLLKPKIVIESSERPTAVLGRRPSGKSRLTWSWPAARSREQGETRRIGARAT